MTAKCVADTSSSPVPRTLLQLFQKITKSLTIRFIVDRSYNGVIKTLRAVYS